MPVACVTDLDVMPDCAPQIIGRINEEEDLPDKANRRWRIKGDFTEDQFTDRSKSIRERADGQNVKTFISDEWTLEYDLAYAGLANDVWVAARLAIEDDQIQGGKKNAGEVTNKAQGDFEAFDKALTAEELASHVYGLFARGKRASKAIAAQYLAERLEKQVANGDLSADKLMAKLPSYLLSAINYVTAARNRNSQSEVSKEDSNGQ